MNANERQLRVAAQHWLDEHGDMPGTALLRGLLAILDRQDRMANEGLTEADIKYLEATTQNVARQVELGNRDTWLLSLRDFLGVIVKLQAQNAELRQLRDLLLNDLVGSDERLAAVREETAKECLRILDGISCYTADGEQVRKWCVRAIRRRFNLHQPVAQPAEKTYQECQYCQGTGDGGPSLYCPRCGGSGRAIPAVCQRCNGQGRVLVASEMDGFAAGLVRCEHCSGTGRTSPPDDDHRSIRRCLENRP